MDIPAKLKDLKEKDNTFKSMFQITEIEGLKALQARMVNNKDLSGIPQ